MKILRLLTLMAFFCALGLAAQAQKTYVLSAGVSKYANGQNLRYTGKDATAFRDVMQNQGASVTTITSENATAKNILNKLSAIASKAKANDKIIFFFSGHGTPGGIVAHDRLLPYASINKVLAKSKSRCKICLIDVCHAGSVIDSGANSYDNPGANIIYMMSCRANEFSKENWTVGHGLFTQSLLKGIRGKADIDSDRSITLLELFNYVYKDVVSLASSKGWEQHPQLIGSKSVANTTIANW